MSSLHMSFAVVATAGLLAGCGFNPLGAEMPKPITVAGYLHETTTGSISANGEPLTAGEYLVASVSYTNEKCHEFFNNLEKLKQDSAFLDSLLTSVVATGAPSLALAETAATVGTTSGIIDAIKKVNTDAATIYFFASVEEHLERLIFDEMAGVLTSKNLDQLADAKTGLNLLRKSELDINPNVALAFFQSSEPVNLMIARNIATEYAAKCTVSNMKAAVARSIAANPGEQKDGSSIEPATAKDQGAPAADGNS